LSILFGKVFDEVFFISVRKIRKASLFAFIINIYSNSKNIIEHQINSYRITLYE